MNKELTIKHQRIAQVQAEDAVYYLSLGYKEVAKYFQKQAARNAEIAMESVTRRLSKPTTHWE